MIYLHLLYKILLFLHRIEIYNHQSISLFNISKTFNFISFSYLSVSSGTSYHLTVRISLNAFEVGRTNGEIASLLILELGAGFKSHLNVVRIPCLKYFSSKRFEHIQWHSTLAVYEVLSTFPLKMIWNLGNQKLGGILKPCLLLETSFMISNGASINHFHF